jgi:hypothetical protein
MAHNYLEQLAAEWYEYQGYFIRRNVWVGKRKAGGYECELDVVGFHPEKKHLVQIEPSMDAASWATREKRYSKKFKAGRKYIPGLFSGLDIPKDVEQIALLVFASTKNQKTLGGGRIVHISEFLSGIYASLRPKDIFGNMVPEQYSILRSFQFTSQYYQSIKPAIEGANKVAADGLPTET